MFKLGLIINPLAGLGGRVGLKGSDGMAEEALRRGARPEAIHRAQQALEPLLAYRDRLMLKTAAGDMGESLAQAMGFDYQVVHTPGQWPSVAADTRLAAERMLASSVDLILFAGGDGTARDLCAAVEDRVPVLGIPAGVKIHSGVYAVTPRHAGEVVALLLEGKLIDIRESAVMDIDEEAFRGGTVRARRYGEMRVPFEGRFVQSVKSGGREVEELVLADIAAELDSMMEDDVLYLVGSGTTCQALMQHLGLANTLLGIDAIRNRELLASDVGEAQILSLLEQYPKARIIVTIIGGQGHILGRGNQQLSPAVLRKVGLDNLCIIATKTKLTELAGRPLLVDTGDETLNRELEGFRRVITGYRDYVMYAVGFAADGARD